MATAPKKAEGATARYKVLAGQVTQGVGDDAVSATAGTDADTVDLTEADAARLNALGVVKVELVAAPAPAPAPAADPAK